MNTTFFSSSALLTVVALSGCGGFTDVSTAGNTAIRGYDPVAMRHDHKAVKGNDNITAEHQGATWHFISTENRDAFMADPERLAPKFGGYCVVALADGMVVDGDPEAFALYKDDLYLTLGQHALVMFDMDPDGSVRRAGPNWNLMKPLRN